MHSIRIRLALKTAVAFTGILAFTACSGGSGGGGGTPTAPPAPQSFSWAITASTNCAINPSTRSGFSQVLVVIDGQELRVLYPDNTTSPNSYVASVLEGSHLLILRARRFDGVTVDAANKSYTVSRNLSSTMSCSGGNVVMIDG